MSLYEICEWLQESYYATAIRESIWVFPIIEGTHVLALGLSVGTIMWFDLRLLGFGMRRHSVSATYNYIKPAMFTGFAIMMISGVLLFYSHALRCYESIFFQIKLVLLILAGVNILIYHTTIDRRRAEWDRWPKPPLQARLAGLISLLMWTSIVAVGRLMAYTL